MKIKQMQEKDYKGKHFTVRYLTKGYYDICKTERGFDMVYKHFPTPVEKSFEDTFFNEWLEDPTAWGAYEENQLVGYVEGALEKWNNRYRISNLCIFDAAWRHRGIGTMLMKQILKQAEASGARMLVLETQNSNENAIAFYHKNGFEIIGFDLYAYTNSDQEQQQIRVEMGRRLCGKK